MIRWLRTRMSDSGSDDDATLAYLEGRASEEEARTIETASRVDPQVEEELESLRETVRMLRSLESVSAPRSFALTEENLARQGYAQSQIDAILRGPAKRAWATGRIGFALQYASMVVAAIAIVGVALITLGDITDRPADETISHTSERVAESPMLEEQAMPARSAEFADDAGMMAQTVEVEGESVMERQIELDAADVDEVVEIQEEAAMMVDEEPQMSAATIAEVSPTAAAADTATPTSVPTATAVPTPILDDEESDGAFSPLLALQIALVILALASLFIWLLLRRERRVR